MKKLIISIILIISSICSAIDIPLLEYRTGSDLMQIRPTAYTAGVEGSSLPVPAAYMPITKIITSTSMITAPVVVGTGYIPLAYDEINEWIICFTPDKLYRATFDGTTFIPTLIFDSNIDNAANPDYAFEVAYVSNNIQKFWCKGNVWLVMIGRYAVPSPGTNTGRMYRSTDAGVSWTQVLSTDYGYLSTVFDCDGFIAVGEYVTATNTYWTANNSNIYVSYDDGLTWDRILGDLDFTVPADNTTRHQHAIIGGDGDEFFTVHGDAKSSIIRYVQRPGGWNIGDGTVPGNAGGQWTATDIGVAFQGNSGIYKDGKFYVACSGGGWTAASQGRITSFDKNDGWATQQYFFTTDDITATKGYGGSTDNSGAYMYLGDGHAWLRQILRANGKYYGFLYKYSTDTTDWATGVGMYVSDDLENWTAIYRDPVIFGAGRNVGIWNGTHFIQEMQSYPSSVITNNIAFYPIPKSDSINAQMVSIGYKNWVGPDDIDNSIAVNDTGEVAGHADRLDLSLGVGEGLYGDNAYHFAYQTDALNHTAYAQQTYMSFIDDPVIGDLYNDYITQGQFYSLGFWVRLVADCPEYWTVNPRLYGTGYDGQNNRIYVSEGWQRVFGTGYVTDSPPIAVNAQPRMVWETIGITNFADVGYASDAEGLDASEFISDGWTLFIHTDRWLSHSLPISIPGTSPYASSDDFIVVPITSTSVAWTFTFEWYPMEGVSNFPHVPRVIFTPANVEINDIFTLTIGGHAVNFTATAATVANVTAGLVAAWNIDGDPLPSAITATDNIVNLKLLDDTGDSIVVVATAINGGATDNQLMSRINCSSPLPIATVVGSGGTYMDLQWDRQNAVFELIDDDSEVVELTPNDAVDHRWLHWDVVKFALTSDGTDTELYMFMPENLSQNGVNVETVTCTSVNLDSPILVKLGTNYAENDVACGAYTNVRFWNSQLDAADITTVFNSPHKMIRLTGSSLPIRKLRPRYK